MADDPTLPKIYDDVPRTQLTVRKADEATALARRIAGDIPPDELEFHCISCGESKSLKFDADEMSALDNDVTRYKGPCWNEACACMTLVPKRDLRDDTFSISRMAQENRRKEAREAAEVQAEVFGEKIADVMSGGSIKAPTAAAQPGRPPGQRDDLPDDPYAKKG